MAFFIHQRQGMATFFQPYFLLMDGVGYTQKPVSYTHLDVYKRQLLTIAICFNFQHTSLALGLYLPDAVYAHQVQVDVYKRQEYIWRKEYVSEQVNL